VLWDSCVYDAGEEIGPLVHGMPSDKTAETVGDNCRTSTGILRVTIRSWPVAWQTFEEGDESL
jgi:hypothetical protein